MSARIPSHVVNEAILVLDVYASQHFWSPRHHLTRGRIVELLDVTRDADDLSAQAWNLGENPEHDLLGAAAEGAQRLREGWRP